MGIMCIPNDMIEHIFSYLSYDEIAKNRLVSRTFNSINSRLLNRGFMLIERRHAMALKSVKAQLPRRESERRDDVVMVEGQAERKVATRYELALLLPKISKSSREASKELRIMLAHTLSEIDAPAPRYHPLSRHCDILTSIETRISMLNMTYSKFIDQGYCCFIPGKVIDEIRRVLAIVETSTTPPRAHEVLQELRDISSMAIEHFDDKISPAFRKRMHQGMSQPPPRPPTAIMTPLALRQEMLYLRRRSVLNAKLSLYLATQYQLFYKQILEYKKIAWRQQKTIHDLRKKQREQDNAMADLKKRIEECDIKYTELTHTNQAAGGKVKGSAAGEVASTSAQPLRHFSSQIKLDLSVLPIGTSKRNNKLKVSNMKPRKPLIKLPSLSEEDSAPPAKIPKKDDTRFRAAPSEPVCQSPRTRSQCTLAKIQGISKELRQLTNLSKSFENTLKRSLGVTGELNVPDSKKQKLD